MAKDREAKNLTSNKKADKGQAQKSSKQKPAKHSTSIGGKIIGYLKGVVQELKRVTWPTPKEMLNSGVIVIVTLIFFALFTFAFDSLAVHGVTALANTTQKSSQETTSTSSSTDATSTTTVDTSTSTTGTSK